MRSMSSPLTMRRPVFRMAWVLWGLQSYIEELISDEYKSSDPNMTTCPYCRQEVTEEMRDTGLSKWKFRAILGGHLVNSFPPIAGNQNVEICPFSGMVLDAIYIRQDMRDRQYNEWIRSNRVSETAETAATTYVTTIGTGLLP